MEQNLEVLSEKPFGMQQAPVTKGEIWSFEYNVGKKCVNMLIICDDDEAEEIAEDLGLKILGKVANAGLYN